MNLSSFESTPPPVDVPPLLAANLLRFTRDTLFNYISPVGWRIASDEWAASPGSDEEPPRNDDCFMYILWLDRLDPQTGETLGEPLVSHVTAVIQPVATADAQQAGEPSPFEPVVVSV
jgi:hypothetical protein